MPVNKDTLDIGCRLHIAMGDLNVYDVGLIELQKWLKKGEVVKIISYGKYGAYPKDFKRELKEIERLGTLYTNLERQPREE